MKRSTIPFLILAGLCLPFAFAGAWPILKPSAAKATPASAEALAGALADAKRDRDESADYSNYLKAAAEYVVNPLPPRKNAIPGAGAGIVAKKVAEAAINRATDLADYETFRGGGSSYSERNRGFYTARPAKP